MTSICPPVSRVSRTRGLAGCPLRSACWVGLPRKRASPRVPATGGVGALSGDDERGRGVRRGSGPSRSLHLVGVAGKTGQKTGFGVRECYVTGPWHHGLSRAGCFSDGRGTGRRHCSDRDRK